MAAINAKKAISNMLSKGFVKNDTHHHYYEFWHEDKLIAKTRSSHNNQDLDNFLISAMAKQCLMPRKFFMEFTKCTKTKADYIKLLEDNGEI